MRKNILGIALLAALGSVATLASANPPAHSNANANRAAPAADTTRPPGVDPAMPTGQAALPSTVAPGQVVPRGPDAAKPRGETVSTIAHATRDFKALDTDRDGMVEQSELPADHALTGTFSDFDLDTNSSLSREEFDTYILRSAGIDNDDDGVHDEEE